MSKEEDEYLETHRCNCQIGILGIPTHQMLANIYTIHLPSQ